MPLEKIYVIRHGFRSNWLVDPATGTYSAYIPSPTGIPADPALTSHGVTQSRELAEHLMTIRPPIEAVYSSPFYRCIQTLEPYVQLRRREEDDQARGRAGPTRIRTENGIGEWFGSAPFDHPKPASIQKLASLFPSIDQDYSPVIVPSQRGETLAQLQRRVAIALRGIIEQCDRDGVRGVALCTHAAVIIVLGRVLTGIIPESVDVEDFHAYTCGLSVFNRAETTEGQESDPQVSSSASPGRSCQQPGSRWPSASKLKDPTILTKRLADATADFIGGWNCELNSDCSFLSGGQERGWIFAGDESFPGTGSLSQGDTASKL